MTAGFMARGYATAELSSKLRPVAQAARLSGVAHIAPSQASRLSYEMRVGRPDVDHE